MTTEPKPKPVYLDNAGYPEPKQGIENTECPSGCFFADFYHVVHVPSCSLFQHRSGEPIDWEKAELWAAGTAQGDARLSQVQAARAFIAIRAEVERLKKLHSDHCSNPICEGPRS